MNHRFLPVLIALVVLGRDARADGCPPGVALRGDPALVSAIGELLVARGIALAAPGCPAVEAQIAARGDRVEVAVTELDGTQITREVDEAHTAATVIESFARPDVGSPLLASREVPHDALPEVRREAPALAPVITRSAGRGVHVFGAFETSYASDRTAWVGGHVGGCVVLGPVCAAARVRFATVASGPGVWQGEVERQSTELLVGLDVPFAIGRAVLSPGFAAGLGQMRTHGITHQMRSETGGMRADIHATLSFPLAHRFALDVFTAADLTQQTRVEWGPEIVPLPGEPRLITRFGIGVHYGGL